MNQLLLKHLHILILTVSILPFSKGQNFSGTWKFFVGETKETLNVATIPTFRNAESIVLPHKVMLPNRVLWYQKRIFLPQSLCLKIHADDGAQVWQNGIRIPVTKNGLFCITGDIDSSELVVRVLNNAVRGGLIKIEFTVLRDSSEANQSYRRDTSLISLNKLLKQMEIPLLNQANKSDSFPLSINIWGDSQGGWDVFSALCSEMLKKEVNLSIGVGDLVSNGINPADWASLHKYITLLKRNSPVMLIPGNHDYDGVYDDLQPAHFLSLMKNYGSNPFYWFFIKNVSFMVLDPNRNFPIGLDIEQIEWAHKVFADPIWRQSEWKVLLIHQVPYGSGWKGYSGEQFIRTFLSKTINESDFDLVVGGHIHDYERVVKKISGKNILCLVTGGAGGQLEPIVNSDEFEMDTIIKRHHFCNIEFHKFHLECKVLGLGGDILDHYIFNKDEN